MLKQGKFCVHCLITDHIIISAIYINEQKTVELQRVFKH
jgi:hypothetical protein